MDNAQKAIMIGVGLFITIIIISAVLLIVNIGTGLTDDATSEVGNISTTVRQQLIDRYQGKWLTGDEVIALYKEYYLSKAVAIHIKRTGTPGVTATLYQGGAGYISVPNYEIYYSENGILTDAKVIPFDGVNYRVSPTKQVEKAVEGNVKYWSTLAIDESGKIVGICIVDELSLIRED